MFFEEEEAVQELQDLGYRVVKVAFPEASSVKTVKDLMEHFYACRLFYNPDRKFPLSLNFKQDTKFISGFLRKRQQAGLSRKIAVQEAAMLIDTLFKFEGHLKLREPVTSPRILEVGSIMDRICTYANGEVDEVGEVNTGMFIDEINAVYNKKYAERDAARAAASRKRILERLSDGKRDGNIKGSPKCN